MKNPHKGFYLGQKTKTMYLSRWSSLADVAPYISPDKTEEMLKAFGPV